jgi:hypothetical protein
MHETKSQRIWAVWAVLAAIALAAAPFQTAFAQCQYEIEAIIATPPCPDGSQMTTSPRGMNHRGDVVGRFTTCGFGSESFFYSKDTGFVVLPRPPGVYGLRADGINDHRIICGVAAITGIGQRGFVYDMNNPDAGFTYLEPLFGVGDSYANAINNANIVAGSRTISSSGGNTPYNACLWMPFGVDGMGPPVVVDLGVMSGPNSDAVDGNEGSDAAGWGGNGVMSLNTRAILWTGGTGQDLGLLPPCVQSHAGRVNANRVVTGACNESLFGPTHSFVWEDGLMQPFPVPDGYESAGASDLNDLGQFVGSMRVEGSTVIHRFLLQHGVFHNIYDLVVDPPSPLLFAVSRIGNDGRIIGSGFVGGPGTRGILLRPFNQPLTDLNHDCRTDVHDLMILLEQWGPVEADLNGTPSADFNEDGVVDVLDLLILLDNWDHKKGGGPGK